MGCLLAIIAMGLILVIMYLFTVSPFLGIILTIGFFVGGMIIVSKVEKQETAVIKAREDAFSQLILTSNYKLKGFKMTQQYTDSNQIMKMMLDSNSHKVAFMNSQERTVEVYHYKDILETEIIEDGQTISKTSRSSQVGGAIVGGVLLGGAGAIIGGLSGKNVSENEVLNLDLKVVVNNTNNPVKIINFLSPKIDPFNQKPLAYKKSHSEYKIAKSKVDHWHSLLGVLIKKFEEQANSTVKNVELSKGKEQATPQASLATQLKELNELKKEGILTEEEFQTQKMKLLNA